MYEVESKEIKIPFENWETDGILYSGQLDRTLCR